MINENFKEKLSNLINNSDMDIDSKILWEIFLKISVSDEDEAVYEAVSESKENLYLLTDHLRDKILSMRDGDKKTWQRLVASESRYAKVLNK